ncbi:MAG: GntR family transcriptional regulator [Rubrobacteraceae bacterium]|nr:GntR family transcriptional regulator [Rubrobacteraceae bacterium]MDQ3304197.1 GntR family transcriptional regulator [Actinomycetota bacterium]MDQ3639830.1 GntR family transcriptional regulator [Actinomycetota bacterium]
MGGIFIGNRGDVRRGDVPLYLQVERRIEDLLLRGRYKAGDRIPPEAELVDTLGVSRVTVRAGLARLADRGVLDRRQGSGTFLVSPPGGARLRSGLERLETYTVHAERLGVRLSSRDLEIGMVEAGPEEADVLEAVEGSPLVRVSRVLLMEGNPAAWMVDFVPENVIGTDRVREHFRPDAMLLDLLVSEGVPVGSSQMSIEAVLVRPEDPIGKKLELGSPSAALSLVQTMYLVDGRPVQRSHDTFLPGKLNLHVVRELFEVRKLG